MTITYTLNKKTAAIGISRSQAYRTPIRRFLLPVLGLVFLAYSSKYLLTDESGKSTFGCILFVLGGFYLVLPFFVSWRAVKNIFAGRSGDIAVKMTPLDEGLEMSAEGSSGTSSWSSFVDFKICKDGVLLYPQKMLHYWIPNTAFVEGGTWQDFESLVSNRIQRKL